MSRKPGESRAAPRGTLRVERDMIPVSYLSDLDAGWKFTDAAGHEHYCDYDGADHYPTLRKVLQEPWYCGQCREVHEDLIDHWECRLCGEAISPGMTGPGTKTIPGMVTYYLDDVPVDKAAAEAWMAEYQAGQA